MIGMILFFAWKARIMYCNDESVGGINKEPMSVGMDKDRRCGK
jgi:hypothetical protein